MQNNNFFINMPLRKNEWARSKVIESECNSIFIIGANGSGKTRLGVWIEEKNKAHRISAQKSLNFNNNISVRNHEVATNLLLYGVEENPNKFDEYSHMDKKQKIKKSERWKSKDKNKKASSATVLLNDYDYALSAFLSNISYEKEEYNDYRKNIELNNGVERLFSDDTLYEIWSIVFPHRNINLKNYKVTASLQRENGLIDEYSGSEMSDGERVALYLIVQALAVPENKTIIIDEPEMHLHPSITNKLWTAIEEARPDCLFVYITHDMDFVASHQLSAKIWVKSYDGNAWEWEKLVKDDKNEISELPEQLLFEILGNRKPVLFIEGKNSSLDYKIYSSIYNEYYIKPCDSCKDVIEYTKSFNRINKFHNLKCYGIVDKDYRGNAEIKSLNENSIYALQVADIENLFLVPELLQSINKIKKSGDNENLKAVLENTLDLLKKDNSKVVLKNIIEELKYKFKYFNINAENTDEVKNKIINHIETEYDSVKQNIEAKFNIQYSVDNYKQIIKIFKDKSLIKSIINSIGSFFDLPNHKYLDFVISSLQTKSQEIIKAILPYLPTNEQIPRTPLSKTNSDDDNKKLN